MTGKVGLSDISKSGKPLEIRIISPERWQMFFRDLDKYRREHLSDLHPSQERIHQMRNMASLQFTV